jgi:tRNA(Ile)-lysidine synthetase-like protein
MPFIWVIITFIIVYFIYKIVIKYNKNLLNKENLLESPKNYYFGKENLLESPKNFFLNKENLLESPKNYYFGKENISGISVENNLYNSLKNYCVKNGAIVSLSGGVDSMVLLACLIKLSQEKDNYFPIFAASIDYSQRTEQQKEISFLIEYCNKYNIKVYITKVSGYSRKKEDSCPRTEFEEESRKIRFNLYKKIIESTRCTGVFVAHHKDDIIENIFTNSMKGSNILDMEVMKKNSTIHNVNIYRPFLDFHKYEIFKLAHSQNIPYFLDTTPKWSRRGKMRFEIFPLLDNVFNQSWRLKLKDLGNQSNEWGEYIQEYIINPWISEVKIGRFGFIIPFKNQPKLIYSNVILKIMHLMGYHMLKKSSILKIINNIKTYNKPIFLDSGFIFYIDKTKPEQFIILNIDDIQNIINTIRNKTEIPQYNNRYEDIIDGRLSFTQPKVSTETYEISVKNYIQMNNSLPRELLKVFTFKTLKNYPIDFWINTNTILDDYNKN